MLTTKKVNLRSSSIITVLILPDEQGSFNSLAMEILGD